MILLGLSILYSCYTVKLKEKKKDRIFHFLPKKITVSEYDFKKSFQHLTEISVTSLTIGVVTCSFITFQLESVSLTDSHWQLALADPNICLQTFTFRREKEGFRDAVPQ